MAQEHGVAGGSNDHAHDGHPHITHTLGRMGTVSYTKHVAHGHEQCIGILEVPCGILGQGRREREDGKWCQIQKENKKEQLFLFTDSVVQ